MKKILTFTLITTLSCGISFGANSFTKSLTNAVKSDVNAVKSAVKSDVSSAKQAVKKDIQDKVTAQTSTAQLKKEEKLKQIETKLNELNKELTSVKSNKDITETERLLQTKTLQRQIDFYNKQKQALK